MESFTIPANVTSIDPEYTANPSPFTGCSRLMKVVVAAGRTSFTISGLKKKTCYYVKIRAYKKNSKGKKIYGAYSARKTIAKK